MLKPATQTKETILALLFFLLLTAIFLRPVVFNFLTEVSGTGDTYEYVWRLWWFKHTLIDQPQSPWIVPFIYYPQGYPLAYSEVTPVNTIFGLPLTIALGEFSAHNTLLFLAVCLTGFTTFLLARELTGNVWAGLLAGVLFGFAPYRRGQYFHLNQMAVQWFPLIFLFLERFLRTGQRRHALAGGIAFGLNALASWYYALAAGLLGLVWLAVRARPWPDYLKQRQTWVGLAIFVGVSAGLIAPFLPPFLAVSRDPATRPPLDVTNFWSASPTDYLIPNPFHPLWGTLIEERLVPLATLVDQESPSQADFEAGRFLANSNLNIATEFFVSPGLVALLFAIYSLRWAPANATRPWLALALVSAVLSLGLTLHLAGRQLIMPAPGGVITTYNQGLNYLATNLVLQPEPFTISSDGGILIPLPALLLRWFVPFLGSVRTWTRFGQFAIFGTAILAAYGATAWYNREIARPYRKRRSKANQPGFGLDRLKLNWPWLILISLALFEVWWKPMPTHPPFIERPVDVWLRQQPGAEAIIQYPLDSSYDGAQFIYTRAHGRPIVQGYGTFFGFVFGRRHPELLTFPAEASLERLSQWGVRYVLIETEGPGTRDAPELLEEIAGVPCLHPATVQGSVHVFELVHCP